MEDMVSIVVPIYNMADSIEKCVNSLISQDYGNLEIILVDDGSKDASYQKCKRISDRNPKVKVYHTENRGSGPARNYGIEKASGKYIYFPDADDNLEFNAISMMVRAMKTGDNDLVVFGFRYVDTGGNEKKIKLYEDSIQKGEDIRRNYYDYINMSSKWGIQGAPWNKFFDLSVIKKYNIEFPQLRRHQDEGFICRYMCYVKSVHFISECLYTYHMNDIKKEWKKYPVDYIDSVTGLYGIRKETILQWNPKDTITSDCVLSEYIANFIKALELAFSPKMRLNTHTRHLWIVDSIKINNFCDVPFSDRVGMYQRIVLTLIKKKLYWVVYMVLHIKVIVQNTYLFEPIRRMIANDDR